MYDAFILISRHEIRSARWASRNSRDQIAGFNGFLLVETKIMSPSRTSGCKVWLVRAVQVANAALAAGAFAAVMRRHDDASAPGARLVA